MKLKHLFFTLAAVACFTTAQAQVKVGANPGTIGSSSSLEVEATNGNKTMVNKATGQVTIVDGTQGAGKVLTSDANGASSWQSSGAAQVNFFATFSGKRSFAQNNLTVKVNFDAASPNVGGGFDSSNDVFTAPIAGIYYFIGTVYVDSENVNGATAPTSYRDVASLKVNGVAKITQENFQYQVNSGGTYGNAFSIPYLIRLNVGDQVELFANSTKPNPQFIGYAGSINAPQTTFQGFLIGQ